jgi:uncharacterized alkaline shock family protein YloU
VKKPFLAALWRLKRVRVFALVGKSGTGKSFRARLVAAKYNINLIIDDGLLIRDQKILAGKSAKREPGYLTAVKTALFTDKEHRREVRKHLENETFSRVLILGTSEGMVRKISATLGLPDPFKIINIEDIATAEEIGTAIHHRKTHGQHVIPVPSIEVKRNYPRFMADSIRVFLTRGAGLFGRHRVYEKSVVRPAFGRKGTITISEAALTQMIIHCIDEFEIEARINKLTVKNEPAGYRLHLVLGLPFGEELAGTLHDLQTYIVNSIERYTGIIIASLDITIDTIAQHRRKGAFDERRTRE